MAGVYLALAIIAEQLWYDEYSWLLTGKVLLDLKNVLAQRIYIQIKLYFI